MIKLGLTGGIGSGKTTVAKVFKALGVPVFYADDEAKKFLYKKEVKDKLSTLFGSIVIDNYGDINKAELANIVFNDADSLDKLNSLIHPLLMSEFNNWVIDKENEKYPYVIMEAAILFEAGFNSYVDKVLCVSAAEESRISRVMKRDGATKQEVLSRINNQLTDNDRESKSDFIIHNSDSDMIVGEIAKINELFQKV